MCGQLCPTGPGRSAQDDQYNTRLLENITRYVAPAIGWVHPDQRTA